MHNDQKRKLVLENVWKNVLVILVTALSWPFIQNRLAVIDRDNFGNFLLVISILLVTVCFANFGFTYRDSDTRSKEIRILSHIATSLFLLLTALLLLTMSLGIGIAYPAMESLFFLVFSLLLYSSITLYDFWDLLRTN